MSRFATNKTLSILLVGVFPQIFTVFVLLALSFVFAFAFGITFALLTYAFTFALAFGLAFSMVDCANISMPAGRLETLDFFERT